MLKENSSDTDEIKNLIAGFKTKMKKGLSASEVANAVFEAIEKNQFYILTHIADHKEVIQRRTDCIINQRNPDWI
ncbi:MAG: hypothetical protein JWM09_1295 [Francisellaceae bacterium]|nr:hypothetical protein [Francisellaceae bacterium]